jgi:hypothetical protein
LDCLGTDIFDGDLLVVVRVFTVQEGFECVGDVDEVAAGLFSLFVWLSSSVLCITNCNSSFKLTVTQAALGLVLHLLSNGCADARVDLRSIVVSCVKA